MTFYCTKKISHPINHCLLTGCCWGNLLCYQKWYFFCEIFLQPRISHTLYSVMVFWIVDREHRVVLWLAGHGCFSLSENKYWALGWTLQLLWFASIVITRQKNLIYNDFLLVTNPHSGKSFCHRGQIWIYIWHSKCTHTHSLWNIVFWRALWHLDFIAFRSCHAH